MNGARLDGSDRSSHGRLDVVVSMDPEGDIDGTSRESDDRCDLRWQRSSVGVAEYDDFGSRIDSGVERFECVRRVAAIPVEEVLGVVEHASPVLAEEGDGFLDHLQVLLRRGLENSEHVQHPALPEDRDDGRLCRQQRTDERIILDAGAGAPRAPERCNLGLTELDAADPLEVRTILRIRSGPSTLDVVDSDAIKPLCDLELVGE